MHCVKYISSNWEVHLQAWDAEYSQYKIADFESLDMGCVTRLQFKCARILIVLRHCEILAQHFSERSALGLQKDCPFASWTC